MSLLLGTDAVAPGTYTASDLGSNFSGSGTIVVIPEPGSLAMGLMAALFFLRRRVSR